MKISAILVVAATASIFILLPSTVTLHVGDAGSRVNEIARYGYGKSIFSLAPKRDANGIRLLPSAFLIGPDGYHLLIWHNDKIDSMTHFRHVQTESHGYGESSNHRHVESFTVSRPSSIPYFIGLAILGGGGFLLSRFRRISVVLFSLLVLLATLMVLAVSVIAEAFSLLPALFAIGWISAALLGRTIALNSQSESRLA